MKSSAALCDGLGVRATARITGVNRETVGTVALRVGRGCTELHDRMMVGLRVNRIEMDELWSFVGSGTFRLRVSNAATFGLTENERGEVRLTELGRRIADAAQEAAARVDAFMCVPLYERIYENYKGFTLPGPGALEKFMRDVGVSSKQTGKARHAFTRSAKQAGFFAHGEDRLVRPAVSGPGTKPIEEPKTGTDKEPNGKKGSGGPTDLHPFIQGLLKELPPAGDIWPDAKRKLWLDTASSIFKIIYEDDEAAN